MDIETAHQLLKLAFVCIFFSGSKSNLFISETTGLSIKYWLEAEAKPICKITTKHWNKLLRDPLGKIETRSSTKLLWFKCMGKRVRFKLRAVNLLWPVKKGQWYYAAVNLWESGECRRRKIFTYLNCNARIFLSAQNYMIAPVYFCLWKKHQKLFCLVIRMSFILLNIFNLRLGQTLIPLDDSSNMWHVLFKDWITFFHHTIYKHLHVPLLNSLRWYFISLFFFFDMSSPKPSALNVTCHVFIKSECSNLITEGASYTLTAASLGSKVIGVSQTCSIWIMGRQERVSCCDSSLRSVNRF